MPKEKSHAKEFAKQLKKEFDAECKKDKKKKHATCHASGGGTYFLGFLGAVVYYISNANSFGEGLIGVLKALVWPGFLVYELLKYVAA